MPITYFARNAFMMSTTKAANAIATATVELSIVVNDIEASNPRSTSKSEQRWLLFDERFGGLNQLA